MTCASCGALVEPGCGYTPRMHGAQVEHDFCTLACAAEWAGSANLQMQTDFATDAEVDIDRDDGEARP